MGKRIKVKHVPNQMESEILKKIGDNKTNEKSFTESVIIDEPEINRVCGFYTYRGDVCILDSLGMDSVFSSYSEKNQLIIHTAIMANKYK